jgi:hypothetical protein
MYLSQNISFSKKLVEKIFVIFQHLEGAWDPFCSFDIERHNSKLHKCHISLSQFWLEII